MEIKTIVVLLVRRITDKAVLGLAVPTPAAAFLIWKEQQLIVNCRGWILMPGMRH